MYVLFICTDIVFEFSCALFVDTNIVVSDALNKKKEEEKDTLYMFMEKLSIVLPNYCSILI